MRRQLRPLAVLVPVLALAACSRAGTDAGGPAAVPFATEPAPSTTATTAAAAVTSSTVSSEMTAEMLTHLLATEQGRQLVITGIAARAGLTTEQATCFVGQVDVSTLVALAQLQGADPAAAMARIAPAVLADLQEAVATCRIPVDALLPR